MEISTESDSEITESSTGDRDVNWELGVAEWGQKCRETSDHVGNEYSRARYVTCDGSGGHEDTDSEHSADAERDEVEPSELALHVGAWTESDLGNLWSGVHVASILDLSLCGVCERLWKYFDMLCSLLSRYMIVEK